jgi:hypothetical protein
MMMYLSSLRLTLGVLVVLALAAGHAAGIPAHRHDILPGPLPYVEVSAPLPSTVAAPSQGPNLSPAAAETGSGPAALTMRVLVISADGTEPSFGAAMATLEQMGIPAQAYIARREGPLTPEKLVQGATARYYAVVLATSTLSYWNGAAHASAFGPGDWDTLARFESRFHIRQVTMYTYPSPEFGFQPSSNRGMLAKSGHLTPEGRRVFSHLNPQADIPIRGAWIYLARATPDAVPLLLTPDGDALAVVKTFGDGRETLAFAMDGNPNLLHTRLLAAGAMAWATRGVYLGERRVYLNAQVDDLFFDDDRYAGPPYRMTVSDLEHVLAWQRAIRMRPLTGAFRLAMAFNGEGSEHRFVNSQPLDDGDAVAEPTEDPLTNAVVASEDAFEWISHTYGHTNLDAITEQQASWELQQNHRVASELNLTRYSRENLVTPDISGLNNPAAMLAAARHGVRYVVSDWSRTDQRARFNTGLRNRHDPRILEIPRYPTNIYYNVTEPGELLEEFGAVHPEFCRVFRDRCPLTYQGLLDFESDTLLGYLFTYDINPLMFHQSNLRQYASGRTLLADYLASVVAKYEALSALPIRTLTMAEIGRAMERREAYNKAGVVGILVPGERITITATSGRAVVPVTGVRVGTTVERYGAEDTSYVTVQRGESMAIPLR